MRTNSFLMTEGDVVTLEEDVPLIPPAGGLYQIESGSELRVIKMHEDIGLAVVEFGSLWFFVRPEQCSP